MTAPSPSLLALPAFRRLLYAQGCFGFAYSIFLILPKYLATHLHASTGRLSWIMASAAITNVAAAPLFGRLSHRTGARPTMAIGCAAMALSALAFIFIDSAGAAAFLARALQGVAWTLMYSAAALLAVEIAPRTRMAEALALHGSANLLTNALGPAFAEPMLDRHGPLPVFAVAAATAVASAWLSLRIEVAPAAPAPARAAPRFAGTPPFVLLTALVLGIACGVMFTLHQPLALARGITRVADFMIAYTVGAVGVRLLLGRLTHRFGARRLAIAAFLLYGGVVAAMPLLGPGGLAGTLAMFGGLFGIAHGVFFPTFIALGIGSAPESSPRAAVMAWVLGMFNGGAVVVIPVGMLAEAYGFGAAFLPVGLATAATALALAASTGQVLARTKAGG